MVILHVPESTTQRVLRDHRDLAQKRRNHPAWMHPAQRFTAPSSIMRGTPLKEVLSTELIDLIAQSLGAVISKPASTRLRRTAKSGLAALELMPRARHIAQAMIAALPSNPGDALRALVESMGPPLTECSGNGLAPFFYLPHSEVIAVLGVADIEHGLSACHALTRRFTAEFAIRPLIIAQPQTCLRTLARWSRDADPHVRRLVSEGSRPRLPWGMRLPAFQADPAPTIALLERLKDDSERYVTRSVANHVGDIAKDHPEVAFALCRRWLDEVADLRTPNARERRWIIRHALRLPAKRGVRAALRLRQDAT